MRRFRPVVAALLTVAVTAAAPAAAADVDFTVRTRIESVIDSAASDASATTSRLRLSADSGWLGGRVRFELELDQTLAVDTVDYSTGVVDRGTAVIPDPEVTEVNRVSIALRLTDRTTLVLGRQALEFDNERFVGTLEFRQNSQSFDALLLTNSTISNLDLNYAYVDKVHRLFGDDANREFESEDLRFGTGQTRPGPQLGRHALDAHLFNARWSGTDAGILSVYGYWIDNEDFARFSVDSFGARFVGKVKPGAIGFHYGLEYAYQVSGASNPVSYHADYYHLTAGLSHGRKRLTFDYEVLGADDSAAFITPLGTLHQFQGWTDKFALITPNVGVRDLSLTASWRRRGFRLRAVAHRFEADRGSQTIGEELAIELQQSFRDDLYRFNLTYVDYRARVDDNLGPGGFENDTAKLFATFWVNLFAERQ
ncbi:MAG: alginate export family protein [Pseudomonadota bacterium]